MKIIKLLKFLWKQILVFHKPILIFWSMMVFSIYFTNWVIENKALTDIRILYLESNIAFGIIIGLSALVLFVKLTHKSPQNDNLEVVVEERIFAKIIEATQGTYFYFALLLFKYSILTLLNLKPYFSKDVDKSVVIALLIFLLIPIIKGLKDIGEYFMSFAKSTIQENEDGEEVEPIN